MKLAMFAAAFLTFVSLDIVVPQESKKKEDKKSPAPLTVKLNVIARASFFLASNGTSCHLQGHE
jgi:hypothetical protein